MMVERVAKAMVAALKAEEQGGNEVSWNAEDRLDGVTLDGSFDLLAVARAAIEAMHKPTDGMLALYQEMAGNELSNDATAETLAIVHRKLIDEALKP